MLCLRVMLTLTHATANGMTTPTPVFCWRDTDYYPPSLEDELARLEKNKDRRLAREKAKGIIAPSPADTDMPPDDTVGGKPQPQGTQRKCANCGQVGHIKTNKKYGPACPMCKIPYGLKPSPLAQTVTFPNSW
jgi:hypothetical protein